MVDMVMAATTSWPDAALGIAGIALVGSVVVVAVWQLLATFRTRIGATSEQEYRRLAEEMAGELRDLREQIGGGASPSDAATR